MWQQQKQVGESCASKIHVVQHKFLPSHLLLTSIFDLLSLHDQWENDNDNNTKTTKEATMIESR
jgi:hypothetical protein